MPFGSPCSSFIFWMTFSTLPALLRRKDHPSRMGTFFSLRSIFLPLFIRAVRRASGAYTECPELLSKTNTASKLGPWESTSRQHRNMLHDVTSGSIAIIAFPNCQDCTCILEPTNSAANEIRSMKASSISFRPQFVTSLINPRPVLSVICMEHALVVKD